MKRSIYLIGTLYGGVTSLIVMALAYLGYAVFTLPFFPFDLFDWLTRHLPGAVIDTVIRTMVSIITTLQLGPTDSVAKLAEQIQALFLVLVTGMLFGLILATISRYRPAWLSGAGLSGGILLWFGLVLIELGLPAASPVVMTGLVWFLVLMVGWGRGLTGLVSRYSGSPGTFAAGVGLPASGGPPTEGASLSISPTRPLKRRDFLALAGSGLVSLIVLGLGLRNLYKGSSTTVEVPVNGGIPATGEQPAPQAVFGPDMTSGPAASPSLDVLVKRIEAAPGTRLEITPADQFYRIDINAVPPAVDAKSWQLDLNGLVQNPLTLKLDDLKSLPSVTQAVTMSCVSNPVGGDLIGTNYWTGVPLKDVLAQAGVQPTAKGIEMIAADGFFEYIPLSEAMDGRTLLVYAMNGQTLTADHGFPLRIYIPNHYGMKQPKWLIGMKVVDTASIGYWVERGWEVQAIPKTTSVIDTVNVDKNALQTSGVMPLGGIAWAGTRGISKVEIQVNDDPWVEAVLRNPTISPLTWVQWRYDWKPGPGTHKVSVRATDGEGNLQETTRSDPGPEGATGINAAQITI